ncbi:MAG: S8 family serine peptidase [Candidatus Sericytochromatia bacterium]|nr:S8 family serine peptidase [Candidatus Sericytochromatia bacterium]
MRRSLRKDSQAGSFLPPTLLVLALSACGAGTSLGRTTASGQSPAGVNGSTGREVLIKLEPGASLAPTLASLAQAGVQHLHPIPGPLGKMGWWQGQAGSLQFLQTKGRMPGVSHVARNGIRTADDPPARLFAPFRQLEGGDTLAGEQYALGLLGTERAHGVTLGSRATRLAIVDSGLDAGHPEFRTPDGAPRLEGWVDYVNLGDRPVDGYGHGTHCAGLAAATAGNAEGIVGQAPGVALLAARVLDDRGVGSDAGVAAGICWAVDHGAKVINLSLGGPDSASVLDDALEYAARRDVLVVAAMGNAATDRPWYPAAHPAVMAVAATDQEDRPAPYGNRGSWCSLAAPGEAMLSTLPWSGSRLGKRYGVVSGTSMAAPLVAGVAALVRERHPGWTAAQVRRHLESTARDVGPIGRDERTGAGRLDAAAALVHP